MFLTKKEDGIRRDNLANSFSMKRATVHMAWFWIQVLSQ